MKLVVIMLVVFALGAASMYAARNLTVHVGHKSQTTGTEQCQEATPGDSWWVDGDGPTCPGWPGKLTLR